MAILALWAGTENSSLSNWTVANNKLPSPISVDVTREEIWDADAGINASGTMVATYVASKRTYNIKWGVLESADFSKITSLLSTGFFQFGEGTPTAKPSSTGVYYRSEISYTILIADTTTWYKDVSVSVIQK